jgi:hypothetical protein
MLLSFSITPAPKEYIMTEGNDPNATPKDGHDISIFTDMLEHHIAFNETMATRNNGWAGRHFEVGFLVIIHLLAIAILWLTVIAAMAKIGI